jgi:hypothetical protein
MIQVSIGSPALVKTPDITLQAGICYLLGLALFKANNNVKILEECLQLMI